MEGSSMALFPESLDEIDFWDLDMFTEGDPHLAWSLLRREAPVWYHDRDGGEPFWCVTRYEDVHAVHADPRRFGSQEGGIVARSREHLAASTDGYGRARSMIHTDPPRHTPLRKVISHNFTPRAIARLEDQLRRFARNCLDEVSEKQDVDFVTDVAHRIPAAIALSLMGVPEEDWDRLAELEHITVTGGSDPEFIHGKERRVALSEARHEVNAYFVALTDKRRANPGEDLLSQLLDGVVEGQPLSPEDVVAEAGLLMAGGLDTTRAAASAGGMLPLLERPGELARLQADPGMVSTAVDEFIRWASPVAHEARTVMVPTAIRDVDLKEGERVVVFAPSANRDDAQFPEPFRYDVTRLPNRHLSFAFGEHYCLGVHLARLTLKVEFEEIVTRFKTIELTGEPVRVRSNFVGGLKHLPVHMVAA
jgi:cholest-4-en-3-one 26-monooxygenase